MNSFLLSYISTHALSHSYEFLHFVLLLIHELIKTTNSQTVTDMGHPVFLATNYNPWLGPFTDTWDDLVSDNGSPLYFGEVHYHNSHSSTFRDRVKPRDVKAALVLLTYLKLEHYTVKDSLVDSSMQIIKDSSEGADVHYNSIGKPNSMFAWFVIDFLSMLILFDAFLDHRSLVAPAPYVGGSLSDHHMLMFLHNKKILIKFALEQGLSASSAVKYFVNQKTGEVGKGCQDLTSLWASSTKFYRQFKAGIVSSFESYKDSYIGEKKSQKLWIHHFVILQLFHPLFRFYPGDDSAGVDIKFINDNHHLFVAQMNKEQLKMYMNIHGETPNYSWLWLGEGGKI